MTFFNGISYNNFYCGNLASSFVNVDFAAFKPVLPRSDFQFINFGGIYSNSFSPMLQAPNYNFFSFKFPPISNIYSNNFQYTFSQPQLVFNQSIQKKPKAQIGDTFIKSELPKVEFPKLEVKPISLELVSKAKSYDGKVNSDAEGNRLFSPGGRSQAWCADFVTFVVKDIYGNKIPSDFGSSAVSGIRDWGRANNCYLAMPNQNKANYIAQNVKPGDIMILKENGRSHTGIVTKINKDGSFEAVEGNCGNKVKTIRYSANNKELSGFVSLQKYA